jgi:methylenetetrahydrofolate reductase (NADPH)
MISIELVPRSEEAVTTEVDLLRTDFPTIEMVNIPDLLRFELRSWEACALARRQLPRAIPHIRAMDYPVKSAGTLASRLEALGLRDALIVQGDSPQDLARAVHPTTSTELIRALNDVDPSLRLYAAFDPYRQGLRSELESVHDKIAAGASGLFTQPFFDLQFMQVCADLLPEIEIFWGISPVTSAGSRRYWEVKNRAIFPSAFEPTLAWNRDFAARSLDWADRESTHLYFMPIRVGLSEYLHGLL